jgi:hypothetical protein
MSKRSQKQLAADRTINFLTGKTPAEEAAEAARIAANEDLEAETEDVERVPIEQAADVSRRTTFECQEWATKHFGKPDAEPGEYRVTLKAGYVYLEVLKSLPGGKHAFGYTGVVFPEADLFKIADVIVQAARAKKAKDSDAVAPKRD